MEISTRYWFGLSENANKNIKNIGEGGGDLYFLLHLYSNY